MHFELLYIQIKYVGYLSNKNNFFLSGELLIIQNIYCVSELISSTENVCKLYDLIKILILIILYCTYINIF